MSLAGFINTNLPVILSEWDAYARTLHPVADEMSQRSLRDHAEQLLQAISNDIADPQSPREQLLRARGVICDEDIADVAALHGALRQVDGFSFNQLTGEFRSLRATVLRMWTATIDTHTAQTFDEAMKFNEAIDEALTQSAITYSHEVLRARDMFLAMLGHDLRTPLGTINTAGSYLTMPAVGNDATMRVGMRIKRNAAKMTSMIDDLLAYASTHIGGKIALARHEANIVEMCADAIEDAKTAHPGCEFVLDASGELVDYFDSDRLQQVFGNLLNNAAQYRHAGTPITMGVSSERSEILITVKNFGPVIPPKALEAIFNPLVQLAVAPDIAGRPQTSIGLGLFIAREITNAHDGSIVARSHETDGTTFTIRLPRTRQDGDAAN